MQDSIAFLFRTTNQTRNGMKVKPTYFISVIETRGGRFSHETSTKTIEQIKDSSDFNQIELHKISDMYVGTSMELDTSRQDCNDDYGISYIDREYYLVRLS